MKKFLILFGFALLISSTKAHADGFDFGGKVVSSFSDVATVGPVMLASGTIRFIACEISSGASNGSITIYRSTSPNFTPDISTQTRMSCAFQVTNTNPNPIDLYGMENDSYTFVQRVGNCEAVLWFTFPDYSRSNPTGYIVDQSTYTGPVSPQHVGLPWNGQR